MEKSKKVKVSLTLEENIMVAAKELADKDDRSLSQYINILLREHIEEMLNKK